MSGRIVTCLLFSILSFLIVNGKQYKSCTYLSVNQLEKEGVITSPESLTEKDQNWCITSPDLCKQVVIVLQEFVVGNARPFTETCSTDKNLVRIADRLYCGKAPANHTIKSNRSSVLISSTVINKMDPAKFKIRYYFERSSYGSCGAFQQAVDLTQEGVIMNTNYPAVEPSRQCTWRIRSAIKNSTVNLVLREFFVTGNYTLTNICWPNKQVTINGIGYCGTTKRVRVIKTGSREVNISVAEMDRNNIAKFRIEFYFGRLPNFANNSDTENFPTHMVREGVIQSSNETSFTPVKKWRITSPDPCKQIILVFKDFEVYNDRPLTNNCPGSKIIVNDLVLCGRAPEGYTLKTGLNEIEIVADFIKEDTFRKFKIEYHFGTTGNRTDDNNSSQTVFLQLFERLVKSVESVAATLKELHVKFSVS